MGPCGYALFWLANHVCHAAVPHARLVWTKATIKQCYVLISKNAALLQLQGKRFRGQ